MRLSRNTTKEWYHICVNGEEIVCTGGHPFYVLNAEEDRKIVRYQGVKSDKNGRWIEAKELKTSDKLLLSDGTCAIINSVAVETLENPETTYNFEVEDFHTYFVSESNVLVHNRCKEVEAVAKKLGYSKVKGQQSHGQAVFANKKASRELRFITPDLDSHNGGYWKAASSIKNLGSKTTRSGTYDMFLRRIGS